MRKILLVFVLVLFLISSVCGAEAMFDTKEYTVSDGLIFREAYVIDRFDEANIALRIGKIDMGELNGIRIYAYKIIIAQAIPISVDVKELTIMSIGDSVTIPEKDFKGKNRKIGMDVAQDILLYSGDPGKVNIVIDGIYERMLIRIKTTNNKVYNLYPSTEFIEGIKRVARWS